MPATSSDVDSRQFPSDVQAPGKVHDGEVGTGVTLVRQLLATQFPQWAQLLIEPVRSVGADNALDRLGDAMVVRLPVPTGSPYNRT